MATIATISNAILKRFQGAPGNSLIVDTKGYGNNTDDAELFQPSGYFNKPQDGITGVVIDCGGGINIVVATNDYKFNNDIEKGETLIYSVDADGLLLSKLLLNKDGKFVLNDGTDFAVRYSALKTSLDNQLSAINQNFQTIATALSITLPTVTIDMTLSKVEEILIP